MMGKSALAEKMVSPVTLSIMYQIDQRISNAIYPLQYLIHSFGLSFHASLASLTLSLREKCIFSANFVHCAQDAAVVS